MTRKLSLLVPFISMLLGGACDQEPSPRTMDEAAQALAEAAGADDYTIEVVDAPFEVPPSDADASDPAAAETLTSDPDVAALKCYRWQDGSDCSTCIGKLPLIGCSVWQDTCGGPMYDNC